jgi:hypothetical protein
VGARGCWTGSGAYADRAKLRQGETRPSRVTTRCHRPTADTPLIGSRVGGELRTAKGAISDIQQAVAPPIERSEALAERDRVEAAATTTIEAL